MRVEIARASRFTMKLVQSSRERPWFLHMSPSALTTSSGLGRILYGDIHQTARAMSASTAIRRRNIAGETTRFGMKMAHHGFYLYRRWRLPTSPRMVRVAPPATTVWTSGFSAGGPLLLLLSAISYLLVERTTSTRRLRALPSGVRLEAIGADCPIALILTRPAGKFLGKFFSS